jgi:hypothetical protein
MGMVMEAVSEAVEVVLGAVVMEAVLVSETQEVPCLS